MSEAVAGDGALGQNNEQVVADAAAAPWLFIAGCSGPPRRFCGSRLVCRGDRARHAGMQAAGEWHVGDLLVVYKPEAPRQ